MSTKSDGWSWSRVVPVIGVLATGAVSFNAASAAPSAPTQGSTTAAPMLYALGDSTGAGVGARAGSYVDRVRARLEAAGKGLHLQNLAESGATTTDVLRDQLAQVPVGAKGLVLVGAGANDLIGGVDPVAFGRQFERLIEGLRSRTTSPIVVSNVPDVSLAPVAAGSPLRSVLVARIDAYNRMIAAIAGRHQAVVFDLCAFTRRELPSHPEYFSSDGFHPSDRGYQAWADGVWRVIERTL